VINLQNKTHKESTIKTHNYNGSYDIWQHAMSINKM